MLTKSLLKLVALQTTVHATVYHTAEYAPIEHPTMKVLPFQQQLFRNYD